MEITTIVTAVIFAVIGLSLGLMLVNWIRLELSGHRNRTANVQVSRAVAYYKHPEVDYLPQGNASSGVYHITFHTDGGDIVKLYMNPGDYYSIEEGAWGELTWQGEKFWKFRQE